MSDTWDDRFAVMTVDGLTHQARQIYYNEKLVNLDLAIVQFTSSKRYQTAKIKKSNDSLLGQEVYASGFPNWVGLDSGKPENTRNWGLKAYKVTFGTIESITNRPLLLGYQLGYTNNIENGMSGGPVIDTNGFLVGINGRLKHPFNGISSYKFNDGSSPSWEEFKKMDTLSWAISYIRFNKIIKNVDFY